MPIDDKDEMEKKIELFKDQDKMRHISLAKPINA